MIISGYLVIQYMEIITIKTGIAHNGIVMKIQDQAIMPVNLSTKKTIKRAIDRLIFTST
jgi:hypothetical protein